MATQNATSSGSENTLVAASFITEVLASAGRLEKDDLNAKLGKLFRRIDEVKAEVNEAIESEYQQFLPYFHVAPDLSDRVDNFHTDVTEVTEKLQTEMKTQLTSSTTEFQELSQKLGEATHMSVFLKYLMELQTLETSAWASLQGKDYSAAGQHLQAMKQKLEELSQDPVYGNQEVDIVKGLWSTCRKHLDFLESQLFESWGTLIKWNLPTQQQTYSNNKQRSSPSLAIQSSQEAKAALENTVRALYKLDLLEPKMKVFSRWALEHIFCPVISEKKAVVVRETSSLGGLTMELRLKKRDKKSEPGIEEVFEVLKTSLRFLNDHLCSISIDEDTEKRTLMALMAPFLSEELLKLIIKHCLAPAIPTNKKDLERFNLVVNATHALQDQLVEMALISDTETSLLNYVQSVNNLFANKKCQEILKEARDLMRSDIHDTVKVCPDGHRLDVVDLLPDHLRKIVESGKEDKAPRNLSMVSDVKLSPDTFQLPTCRVSLSTQQLVKLIYEVLYEATQCDEACALQFFSTVRQIIELYIAVVPTYHKDKFSKLPQLAALHHNNCIYLAHYLLILKHEFNAKLPEAVRDGGAPLVDMVPGVRRAGVECFIKTMTTQRDQLLEHLSAGNGFVSVSDENNRRAADQAIGQVFDQLGLLANDWRGILPQNVYANSIGTLLKYVMKDVIDSVIALDDISADDATQLAELLGIFVDRAPALFTLRPEDADDIGHDTDDVGSDDKNEDDEESTNQSRERDVAGLALLMKNVSKWGQLQELRIVLNAGLMVIADRWADAKGPLAVQFSANEVKRLVRALFQNTDRRAAVLATIRQPVKN